MLSPAADTSQDRFTSATMDAPTITESTRAEETAGATSGTVPREPVIHAMFRRMSDMGASDLHLSATMAPLVRKDGEMRRLHDAAGPLSSDMIVRLLGEIMPSVNKAEFEARRDSDFAYEIQGLARFRANVFMDRHGMGAVFRVIPSKILTSEQLGLSPHVISSAT